MASELLKRSEVKEADTWNVKDMYPTTEAWENELKVITEIVDKIASYEGSVAATAENLLTVLEHLASAGEKIEKAFNYAERLFDEDQTKHHTSGDVRKSIFPLCGNGKQNSVCRSGNHCSVR